MGVLRQFWRWLTGEGRQRNYDYGDPRLTPISIERLVNDLQVPTVARELGEKCLPNWSGPELAGAELQIIFEIQRIQEGYGRWAAQRLAVLNHDINACDLVAVINRAGQIGKEFEREASSRFETWRAELSRLHAKYESRANEFTRFKDVNRLSHEPHYPSPGRKTFGFAFLVFLVLLEGGLNSFFFSKGVWGGLIGGFAFAVIFSLLNVLVGAIWGRVLFPYVHHVDWYKRFAAMLSTVTYAAILLGLALFIGHYRDLMQSGPVEMEAVLQSIQEEPHKLKDLQSWILAILTVICGLLAFADAYHLEEPYPGYGSQHRKLMDASDEYEAQKGALYSEFESLRLDALLRLDRLFEDAKVALRTLDAAIHQKDTTRQSFEGAVQEVDKAARALIGIFRDQNLKARPEHCRQVSYPPFPGIKTPILNFDSTLDRQKYTAQNGELDHLRAQIEEIRAHIQSSFNRQLNAQQPVDTIVGPQRRASENA